MSGRDDYTLSSMLKVLKRNSVIVSVVFTSREPTLNLDLAECIKAAKDIGYREILLVTNGRMLSYMGFAEKLVQSGLNGITVSIHGHTGRLHDSLTRCMGSFGQTINGIKNLSLLKERYDLRITTSTVVVKQNCESIIEIIKLSNSLGSDNIQFNPVEIRGSNTIASETITPSYSFVGKTFCDAVELAEASGICRAKIGILAPFCIVRRGFYGNVIGFENANLGRAGPEGRWLPSSGKTKGEQCKICIYNRVCGGVSEGYAKIFGLYKFKPILEA
jgi:MoaA/NifB/PqqE/SkfB family radical SAM enzyme